MSTVLRLTSISVCGVLHLAQIFAHDGTRSLFHKHKYQIKKTISITNITNMIIIIITRRLNNNNDNRN